MKEIESSEYLLNGSRRAKFRSQIYATHVRSITVTLFPAGASDDELANAADDHDRVDDVENIMLR